MHIGYKFKESYDFSEILDGKYYVIKKLGWGHFSTVWLAFNIKDKKMYALKIMRSHPKYYDTGYDEEELCRIVFENAYNPACETSL